QLEPAEVARLRLGLGDRDEAERAALGGDEEGRAPVGAELLAGRGVELPEELLRLEGGAERPRDVEQRRRHARLGRDAGAALCETRRERGERDVLLLELRAVEEALLR